MKKRDKEWKKEIKNEKKDIKYGKRDREWKKEIINERKR